MHRRRSGVTLWRDRPVRLLAIAAGGSLGTLSRYGIGRALAPPALGFPWPTLLVNLVGSLLLGVVVTLLVERWPPTRFARPFAAIGFCGGFTTFSTVMVESTQLGRHGRIGPAALYLGVTLGAGLAAAAGGIGLARLGLPVTRRRPIPDPDDLGPLGGLEDVLDGVPEGVPGGVPETAAHRRSDPRSDRPLDRTPGGGLP